MEHRRRVGALGSSNVVRRLTVPLICRISQSALIRVATLSDGKLRLTSQIRQTKNTNKINNKVGLSRGLHARLIQGLRVGLFGLRRGRRRQNSVPLFATATSISYGRGPTADSRRRSDCCAGIWPRSKKKTADPPVRRVGRIWRNWILTERATSEPWPLCGAPPGAPAISSSG